MPTLQPQELSADAEAAKSWFEKVLEYALEVRPKLSDLQLIDGGELWTVAQKVNIKSAQHIPEGVVAKLAEAYGQARGGRATLAGPTGTLELSATISGRRCRMAFRRQYGGDALTVRVLPAAIPLLDGPFYATNPVPESVIDVILSGRPGIGVIGGATESGKSTLLISLLQLFNTRVPGHIMTLEDPIEYLLTPDKCVVSQREIPTHAASFEQGILTGKRSNPSVILIGELRDRETMRAAIEFASQGHLVLATSHASNAMSVLNEFLGAFDSAEVGLLRQRLSQVFHFALCQKLIVNDRAEIIPARELLIGTTQVRANIALNGMDEVERELDASRPGNESFSYSRELRRLADAELITRGQALKEAGGASDLGAVWHMTDVEVERAIAETVQASYGTSNR